MIVCSYGLKPSGLYRHRRGLGLHKVGYKGGDIHIVLPSLPSMPSRVPSGHGTKSSILYLHSPTVQLKYIVRLSEDPLIQDSLSRVHGVTLNYLSCNPQWETTVVACVARSLPRVEHALYPASLSIIVKSGLSIQTIFVDA